MLTDQKLTEAARETERAEMEARRQEALANLRLEESQQVKMLRFILFDKIICFHNLLELFELSKIYRAFHGFRQCDLVKFVINSRVVNSDSSIIISLLMV